MKKNILMLLVLAYMPVLTMAQTTSATLGNKSTSGQEITVTAETLSKYAGVYQLDENFKVTISVEGNKLYALAPGDQEKSEFIPKSNTRFYMKDSGAEIEFIEEGGKRYLLVKMKEVMKLAKVS